MIPSVYEYVFEWLNVTSVVKCFELLVEKLEKRYRNANTKQKADVLKEE